MPEPTTPTPFTVTPGTPTVVQVMDLEGREHEIAVQVAVLTVRPTNKKDPNTGKSAFDVEVQVALKTSLKERP